MKVLENKDLEIKKALGQWKPDLMLTNLSLAWYESDELSSKRIFPVVPVQLPAGKFYIFNRDDLARNQVQQKPPYGAVSPAVFSLNEASYTTKLHQIIIGLDQILDLPFQRAKSAFDMERARAKTVAEQISQKQELDFAEKFFNSSAWANTWQGAATDNPAQKKFKKFTAADSNPIKLFDELCLDIRKNGRRRPNKLVLGAETFIALKNNATVLERVKYSGATANPAVVNENVLAQLFGVESVVVLSNTKNVAKAGKPGQMEFICEPTGALLLYTPDKPLIDEPSAGYCFTWLINGNDYIALDKHDGAPASHVTLLEGLVSYCFEKTSDELAVFLAECC